MPGLTACGQSVLLLEGLGDPLAQFRHHRVVGGDEALVLAAEVLVEGAPGDGRVAGDVGDGCPRVAVLGNRLGEAGDQALALVVGDELARQAVPAGGKAGQLRRILASLLDRGVGGIRGHRATIPVGEIRPSTQLFEGGLDPEIGHHSSAAGGSDCSDAARFAASAPM